MYAMITDALRKQITCYKDALEYIKGAYNENGRDRNKKAFVVALKDMYDIIQERWQHQAEIRERNKAKRLGEG